MSYRRSPSESTLRQLDVRLTKGCECEFCGRDSYLGGPKTCEGCGAPNTAKRVRERAMMTPAIIYDQRVFNQQDSEFMRLMREPMSNIPINVKAMTDFQIAKISDVVHEFYGR